MKRAIIITLITIAIIAGNMCAGYCADGFSYKTVKHKGKYETRFYDGQSCIGKIRTGKRLKVKVVKSEKLTARTLEHRRDKYIIVEVVNGKCINSKGDGKTSDGYYISYKRVKGHKAGNRYKTYCVYGNNNGVDDVVIRADYRK